MIIAAGAPLTAIVLTLGALGWLDFRLNMFLNVMTPLIMVISSRFDKHATHSDIPLLADFWASWCGPCRAMAPIFEQTAKELEPDVRLVKVDSDAVPELLHRFGIQSIPTLMLVHHGREIARKSGVMSLPQLLAWTREHVEGVKV
jgi:thioredoxin 2